MKRENTYQVRKISGFTLVELIVVLVLVSVLCAIGVPTYLGFVDNNKAKQCDVNRAALASYLDNMLVTQSDATMQDVIDQFGVENADAVKCPLSGDIYEALSSNTVRCSTCDKENTVIMQNNSVVQADKLLSNPPRVKPSESGEKDSETETTPSPPTNSTEDSSEKLEVSLEKNFLSLQKNASESLRAIVTNKNCTISNYTWKVQGNTGIVSVVGNQENATITGHAAGTDTVICEVSAVGKDGKTITEKDSVSVTVTEVYNASVTVTPASIEIEEGETYSSLIATSNGCDASSYEWTSGNESIATVQGNWNSGVVSGIKEGNCVITCKMGYYVGGTQYFASATVNVLVKKKQIPTGDVFGDTPGSLKINGGEGKSVDPSSYIAEDARGGQWSVVSGPVETAENSDYIKPTGEAGDFVLRYTAPDGRTGTISGVVLFPHTSFQTTPNNSCNIVIDDEIKISGNYTAYGPEANGGKTTDGPVVWENQNPDIVSLTVDEGSEIGRIANVKALAAGTATVIAKLQHGINNTWTECPVIITVAHKKITGIQAKDIEIQEDGTAQIEIIGHEPETGINPDDLQYIYECYDGSQVVSVSPEGVVTGLKKGTAEVTIKLKSDNSVSTTCKVTVTENSNRIKRIYVYPSTMSVSLGQEEQKINVQYFPATADVSDVKYTYEYYTDCFDITEDGMVHAKKEGEADVTIKAMKTGLGIILAECKLKITVVDPNKLTGIKLNKEKLDIQQGGKAKITVSPDENNDGIIVYPIPTTAKDYDISYRIDWDGLASVDQQGNITANSDIVGSTRITITATRKSDNMSFYGIVTLNVTADPNKPVEPVPDAGIKLDYITVDDLKLIVDKSKNINTNIRINPSNANMEGAVYSYSLAWGNSDVVSVSGDGTVTGQKQGNVGINVKVTVGDITKEATCQITVQDLQVVVNGNFFKAMMWKDFRDYLKEHEGNSGVGQLSPSTVFITSTENPWGGYFTTGYILKKNAVLNWSADCENFQSFDEYLQAGNQDQFIQIKDQITWYGNSYSGGEGTIFGKDGKYYVCVEQVTNYNTQEWSDDYINEHFVLLS